MLVPCCIPRIVKFMKIESRMVGVRAGELLFNGYTACVLQNEKSSGIGSGDSWTTE